MGVIMGVCSISPNNVKGDESNDCCWKNKMTTCGRKKYEKKNEKKNVTVEKCFQVI
jgi:hypothetical protein